MQIWDNLSETKILFSWHYAKLPVNGFCNHSLPGGQSQAASPVAARALEAALALGELAAGVRRNES